MASQHHAPQLQRGAQPQRHLRRRARRVQVGLPLTDRGARRKPVPAGGTALLQASCRAWACIPADWQVLDDPVFEGEDALADWRAHSVVLIGWPSRKQGWRSC